MDIKVDISKQKELFRKYGMVIENSIDINTLIECCLDIGYNEGCKDTRKKYEERDNKILESLNNIQMHIESDERLKAHGSINYIRELLKIK